MHDNAERPVRARRRFGDLHGAKPAHAHFAKPSASFEATWNGSAQIDEAFARASSRYGNAQCGRVGGNLVDDFPARALTLGAGAPAVVACMGFFSSGLVLKLCVDEVCEC